MIGKAKEQDLPELLLIWEEAIKSTHDFLTPADFPEIRIPRYFKMVDLFGVEREGVV